MIRIDRSRVPVPAVLASAEAEAALGGLGVYFAQPVSQRAQTRPPFHEALYQDAAVTAELRALFHNKCGYCENPFGPDLRMNVELFRPSTLALNADGSLTSEGYWWLAYEWTNFYAACANCQRMKGPRFPVLGKRATPPMRGEDLESETALLLDPCRDDPEDHLMFMLDGTVATRTERGRITIAVLSLNRDSLVDARRAALKAFKDQLVGLSLSDTTSLPGALLHDDNEFAAARRQLVRPLLEEIEEERRAAGKVPLGWAKRDDLTKERPAITDEKRLALSSQFARIDEDEEAYSVADENGKRYFARYRPIDRIEIRNFRPIEALDLRFPELLDETVDLDDAGAAGGPAPWLMLLGENSSGKTSVLQAVALTLAGEERGQQLDLDAGEFVRIGAEEGTVKVFLTGSRAPIELSFSRGSRDFVWRPADPKVLLLGYGATRLPPGKGAQPAHDYDFARIDNLFNAFVPLNDASAWLSALPEPQFQHVSGALKPLLQLGERDRLVRRNARVEVDASGVPVPLDALSDGYQSMLAVTTDIMRVVLHKWPAIEIAEGIVLLDEIGSHLHPRWKMRIVGNLRRVFPRMQFLASTHDPLCLRGLTTGEVAVMTRGAKGIVATTTELPPIKGLRVDQLLTSEYFGLDSTVDPELDDLFSEYYRLLALPELSSEQSLRVCWLKTELHRYRQLGSTRRESMMLDVIDEYLASEPDLDLQERAERKAVARETLRKIWTAVRHEPDRSRVRP